MVVAARERIAVIGGDGRAKAGLGLGGAEVVRFKSRRDGGNGEARRLAAALKAGGFTRVIILVRWNGHSVTRYLRRLCRKLGVLVELAR